MRFLPILLFSIFFSSFSVAQVIYVTPAGAGSKNGASWANAFDKKQFADTSYTFISGTQVWIAAGTYYPTKKVNGAPIAVDTDSALTIFVLNRGVKFYGGFVGAETSINDRQTGLLHAQNQTVLSADYNADGFNGNNTLNVLTMPQCGAGEVLDGITVAGALQLGIGIGFTSPATTAVLINDCVVRDNSPQGAPGALSINGGAIPGAAVNISNSYFINNFSSWGYDGCVTAGNCVLKASNCVFYNNSSGSPFMTEASCIHFGNASGEVANCTFYANNIFSGNPNGYAILLTNVTDSVYINNSIFWGNYSESAVANIDVNAGANRSSVKNCIFETQVFGAGAGVLLNSVSTNPLFVNAANPLGPDNTWGTTDDGLILSAASPSINNGRNEFIPASLTRDIMGNARVIGCRVDIGAYEYTNGTFNTNGLYNGIGQSCTSFPVNANSTTYADSISCHAMTTVVPSGSNPLNGSVQVCVTNSASVPVVNGIPYVPRHYDIIPATNAATATARISIYFTQPDFNSYNAAAGAAPHLPTGPSDAAGIANILIEQNHGVSVTGVPGTYNGTTVYINPADNDIIWNAANGVWEVSFDVTGFSGFFMTTTTVVPIELVVFSGKLDKGATILNWTTSLEINTSHFNIQRSNNGRDFITLGNLPASGNQGGSSYSYTDKNPAPGKNFYRLESVDVNGRKDYSDIILLSVEENKKTDFTLIPNPAHTQACISISGLVNGKTDIFLYDLNGRKIRNIYSGESNNNASFSTTFSVAGMKPGVYIVSVHSGNHYVRERLIIE